MLSARSVTKGVVSAVAISLAKSLRLNMRENGSKRSAPPSAIGEAHSLLDTVGEISHDELPELC